MNQSKKKSRMVNITINLPEIYDDNIKKLVNQKIVASRSEAIRIALRDFLHQEYNNLKLLGCFS
ncbi:MAG: ribbon-helix-helix domain-containing protein [Candidatus Odinarchaeota archaeon]